MARSWSIAEIRKWTPSTRPAPGAIIPPLFSGEALKGWVNNIIVSVENATAEKAANIVRDAAVTAHRRVISEQTARSGGIAPQARILVDGREDASLATVKPESIVTLLWSYLPEVAYQTYRAWWERSPRRTGAYQEGLTVFVDGEPAGFQAITIDTREVRVVATVAYSRRLEVGKDASGGPFVKQVAPHIAEETAIVARRLYANRAKPLASIQFTYLDIPGGHQLTVKGMTPRRFTNGSWHYRPSLRTRNGFPDATVRYPAIVIGSLTAHI